MSLKVVSIRHPNAITKSYKAQASREQGLLNGRPFAFVEVKPRCRKGQQHQLKRGERQR